MAVNSGKREAEGNLGIDPDGYLIVNSGTKIPSSH
jgi:hypothetical protein